MRLFNPTEVNIEKYPINGEFYTLNAGDTIDVDDKTGKYLMGIYAFLREVEEEKAGEKEE